MVEQSTLREVVGLVIALGPVSAASVLWMWLTLGVPGGVVPTPVRVAGTILFGLVVTAGLVALLSRAYERSEQFQWVPDGRTTNVLSSLPVLFFVTLLATGLAVLVIAPSRTARLYAVAVGCGLVGVLAYLIAIAFSSNNNGLLWIVASGFFLSIPSVAVIILFDENPIFENIVGGVAAGLLFFTLYLLVWSIHQHSSPFASRIRKYVPWETLAVTLFGIAGLLVLWATVELGFERGLRAAGTTGAVFVATLGGISSLYMFRDNETPLSPTMKSLTVEWVLGSVGGSAGVLGLGVGIPAVLLSVDASIASIYAVGVLVAAAGWVLFSVEREWKDAYYLLSLPFVGGSVVGLVTLDWIAQATASVVVFTIILLTGFSIPLGLGLVAYVFDEVALIVLPVFVLVCGVGLWLTAPVAVVLAYVLAVILTGLCVMFLIGSAIGKAG